MTASTACAECRHLLGGYVLGALDPVESEIVRDHVAGCAACALELTELEDVPRLLDVADMSESPAEQPPAALEEAVLDRFAREHRGAPRRRSRRVMPALRGWRDRLSHPLPAAAAAGLAAALVAVVLTQVLDPKASEPGAVYHAQLAAAAPEAAGGSAYASLRTLPTGTEVHLKVHGMPTGSPAVYEMWCVGDDGTKVSAGTFRLDASGGADVHLTAAARLGEYSRVSVEQRKLGDPSGRRVLAGEIGY